MLESIKNIFTQSSSRGLEGTVRTVASFEEQLQGLSLDALREESVALQSRAKEGVALDELLPRAFALVREAAHRTLRQRPYDVQLTGGIVLHRGGIIEMMTGEGKTLAAVAPAYLNALAGKGVHVVTVNEYLARRDAVWMGQIYRALGLSVACLVPNAAFLYDPAYVAEGEAAVDAERDATGAFKVQQEFLRPISRREAYLADITYGTNHEFGFDYLRDNLAYRLEDQVQRARINADQNASALIRADENPRTSAHYYAIIDEVDSILIDEARTPLIIAAPDSQSSEFYKTFARVVSRLQKEEDYTVDEKRRAVHITESGIGRVEQVMGIRNLYAPENLRLVHYLEESLRAKVLYQRDKDYVVKHGEIFIVDEFTGRLLQGRRYNGGLHQAIEAKEGVFVKEESKTYAKISIQNYFRMYEKISGMTGTAQTSAEEFHKVYGLDVVSIPPNRPCVRADASDMIYKSAEGKWNAIVEDVRARHEKGQPILIGTTSIEKNELLGAELSRANIPHEMLNAKNNEREGAIIAQAGRWGAVTVATNLAGRGVDIILGGNPPSPEEAQKVREAGGLHVVGTERHEARRIDNQLRGRSGRQGDPGSSQFFLSLDDDLLRIFGGEKIKGMMERFDLPEDQPIQMNFVSKAVAQAQSKVEGANFDLRKHLLEYDDVLNKQRSAVYKRREEILASAHRGDLPELVFNAAYAHLEAVWEMEANLESTEEQKIEGTVEERIKKLIFEVGIARKDAPLPETIETHEDLKDFFTKRSVEVSVDPQTSGRVLSILDLLWMTHLEHLDALSESVGLRAYGQKDPLVEYRHEAHRLFKDFWATFNAWIFMNVFRLAETLRTNADGTQTYAENSQRLSALSQRESAPTSKIGRNDPCPCGSGKKYKKCHGK